MCVCVCVYIYIYCSAHSWAEQNGAELSNESPRKALFQPSSPPIMNFISSALKLSEGMCSWAFVLINESLLHPKCFTSIGFLCDSTAELQLSPTTGHAHSPHPKHASFLRVTEWVKDEDTPTLPANQSRMENIQDSHTAVRPDCYKHFTPRFKTSMLDQVYIFNQLFINMLISKWFKVFKTLLFNVSFWTTYFFPQQLFCF